MHYRRVSPTLLLPIIIVTLILIQLMSLSATAAIPKLEGLVCSTLDGENAVFLLRGSSGYVNRLVIVNTTTGSLVELRGFSQTNDYNILAARTLGERLYVAIHSLHDNKIYIYIIPNITRLAQLGTIIDVMENKLVNGTIELYLTQGTIEEASASIGEYAATIYSIVLVPQKKSMVREPVIVSVEFYGKPTIEKQEIVNVPGQLFIPPNSACASFIAGLSQNTLTLATYSSIGGALSIYATLPQPPDPTSITLLKTKSYIVLAYTTLNSTNTVNLLWFSRSSGKVEETVIRFPNTTISVRPEEIVDLGRGKIAIQAMTITNLTGIYRSFVIVDYTMRRATIFFDRVGVLPDYLLVPKGLLKLANGTVALVSLRSAEKEFSKLGGNYTETLKFEPVVGTVAPATTQTAKLFEISFQGLTKTTTTAQTPRKTTHMLETAKSSSTSGRTSIAGEERRRLAVIIVGAVVAAAVVAVVILYRRGVFSRPKRGEEAPGTVLDVGI